MKLVRARVTNYKSIEDSGWVAFNGVTCLVGKNEAGKTVFLRALEKINPAPDGSSDFDPVLDFPRKDYAKYKKLHEKQPAVVVAAEFQLSDHELAEIEGAFGKDILPNRTVSVTKNYKNQLAFTFDVAETVVVKNLVDGAGLPDEIKAQAAAAASLTDLGQVLRDLQDKPPSAEALLKDLQTKFKKDIRQQIVERLEKVLPVFVYFDDYSIMNGRISIQDLRQRRDQKKLGDPDRTFLALLGLVGAKLEEFDSEKNYERIKAELEAASINITDEVFQFWSQNKQLSVEFDLSAADPKDPAPLNAGTILHVRIKNERHRVTVQFDDRSRGFVWFFSFLAYFSQLEGDGRDLVLLLDEPGLNLHAKAQGDFLRFIDERLAPKHQVLYSTHSPFMINPRTLQRVRTVQDVDGKGTLISDNVLRNDRDTVYPLQAALGYDLAQTLFVGPHCLLVEGSSDLIYLQVLSEVVRSRGRAGLDGRWVVIPVGGADKIATFVSLLGGHQLDVAILMDVSAKDRQRIEQLQAHELLRPENLIPVGVITGAKDADIEDLFSPGFYLKLVNGSYAAELGSQVGLADVATGHPRIVKKLEDHFTRSNLAGSRFDHYRPAVYLLREQTKLVQDIDDQTIERAAALFAKVNTLLPPVTSTRGPAVAPASLAAA